MSCASGRLALVSSEPVSPSPSGSSLEVPVDELFHRARPLPPAAVMVIADLTVDEGDAFLAALEG